MFGLFKAKCEDYCQSDPFLCINLVLFYATIIQMSGFVETKKRALVTFDESFDPMIVGWILL